MQRASSPGVFADIYKKLDDLEKLVRARTNNQIVTLPTFDHTALPHDMQNASLFVGTDNKLYVYITGTGAVRIGP